MVTSFGPNGAVKVERLIKYIDTKYIEQILPKPETLSLHPNFLPAPLKFSQHPIMG